MNQRSWRDRSLSNKLWRVTSRQANKATLETNQKTEKRIQDTLKLTTKLLKINGWKMHFLLGPGRRTVSFLWIWAFWNSFAGICWVSYFFGETQWTKSEEWMKFCHLNECRQILQEHGRRCTKRHQVFDIHWNSSELRSTKTTVFKGEFTCGRRGSVAYSMAGSQSQIKPKTSPARHQEAADLRPATSCHLAGLHSSWVEVELLPEKAEEYHITFQCQQSHYYGCSSVAAVVHIVDDVIVVAVVVFWR